MKAISKKQEEALRIDPVAEARQVQEQRAQEQAASHDPQSMLQDIQDASDISPIQTLDSLFLRQKVLAGIATGEQLANSQGESGLIRLRSDAIIGTATSDSAKDLPPLMTRIKGGPSSDSGQQKLEEILKARNSEDADISSDEIEKGVEEARRARDEEEQLATQDKRDELIDLAKNIKDGELLSDDKDEEAEKAGTQRDAPSDPFRAAIEHAAASNQTLSESRSGQSSVEQGRSPLVEQIRSDNFIAEIQRMQTMQFSTANANTFSAAA